MAAADEMSATRARPGRIPAAESPPEQAGGGHRNGTEGGAVRGARTAEEEETPEGLDDTRGASWGEYPIDSLLIRSDKRRVHEVLRQIEKGRFVMDPEFQRDCIWPEDKQSRLIESVLLRIPLPVLYLAEDSEGRMVVVDGLQRLSTFKRFVGDRFRLRLEDRPELDGKRFSDLSPKFQNRIDDCYLTLHTLDWNVPDRARLDIFERVNSGAPLSRQQMRNALCPGPATKFLKVESRTEIFLEATGRSLHTGNMRDREFVNRFCAFRLLGIENYRDLDDFLAAALKKMNDEPKCLPPLSADFRRALRNNLALFGRHAFRRRRRDEAEGKRRPLNAALWDVMTTGLSSQPPEIARDRADDLRNRFYDLMEDEEFGDAITYGANGVKKVRRRFELANSLFGEVFGARSG